MKDLFDSIKNTLSSLIGRVWHLREIEKQPIKPSIQSKINAKSWLMSDAIIEGQLNCDENLAIDGQFKGNITAKNNSVAIGPSGQVYADIRAKEIIIEGVVMGDIIADHRVLLAASGRVAGNIQAAVVDLQDGARFRGIIEIDPKLDEPIDRHHEAETKIKPVALEPS